MTRTTVTTERLKQLADPNMICKCSWDEYKSISAELLAVREAQSLRGIRVGNLPTMNQDEYPGLPDWWVQLRIGTDGDEVLARIYGSTPHEAMMRARAIAAPTAPAVPDDYFSNLVNAGRLAADKAMRKHPQPNYVLLKVAEEAGEVVQAGVHFAEGRMTWQDLEGEIVQLLAMLIRLVTEGDQVNGIKPPASCSTAALAAAPDEIDIFVDQVCGNLPAGHQQ